MQQPKRRAKAKALYEAGRTMQQIADELGVNKATISRDLEGCCMAQQPRPKGGRPKGATLPRSQRNPKAHAKEERVAALRETGLSTAQIAATLGMHERSTAQALEHRDIWEEGFAAGKAFVDPEALPLSDRERLEAVLGQEKYRLAGEFNAAVSAEYRRRLAEVLPHYHEREALYNRVIENRRGIMSKATYTAILRCLHPDSRGTVTADRLQAAFRLFSDLEKLLLAEADSPTDIPTFPATMSEWDELRRKTTAQRRRKR